MSRGSAPRDYIRKNIYIAVYTKLGLAFMYAKSPAQDMKSTHMHAYAVCPIYMLDHMHAYALSVILEPAHMYA